MDIIAQSTLRSSPGAPVGGSDTYTLQVEYVGHAAYRVRIGIEAALYAWRQPARGHDRKEVREVLTGHSSAFLLLERALHDAARAFPRNFGEDLANDCLIDLQRLISAGDRRMLTDAR